MITGAVQRWSPVVYAAIHAIEAIEPERVAVALSQTNLDIPHLADVILGIIQRETAGNNTLPPGDGGCSFGLMQVNWCTRQNAAGRLELQYPGEIPGGGAYILRQVTEPRQLTDPYVGIAVGTRFFIKQLAELGDVNHAILAYNAPASTRRWLAGELPAPVNQGYLDFVLGALGVSPAYFAELKKKRLRSVS